MLYMLLVTVYIFYRFNAKLRLKTVIKANGDDDDDANMQKNVRNLKNTNRVLVIFIHGR